MARKTKFYGVNANSEFWIGGVQVTATAAELNILEDVTATTAEINYLDNDNLTAADLTKLAAIDATAAEVNLLDDQPAGVTYSVGSEQDDGTITVGVQLTDAAAVNTAAIKGLFMYLSTDSAGTVLASDPGTVEASTGMIVETLSNQAWYCIADSAGSADIKIVDDSAGTYYLTTVMPTGALDVSGSIVFA